MNKTKNDIVIDLKAMLEAFRYCIYCFKFTEHFKNDLNKIDVLSISNKKQEVILGSEFSGLLLTKEGAEYLLGNASALLRANLITSSYERVKGYCKHSSKNNSDKFFLQKNHDFVSLIQLLHILRGVTAHWSKDENIVWKDGYPDIIQFEKIILKRGIKRGEIIGDNKNIQSVVEGLINFVSLELE